VAPAGDGTLTVSLDARDISLLTGRISLYDDAFNLLGTADAATYGGVATLFLSGLTAGRAYYLVADGAPPDVFGMGAYKLSAQFGAAVTQPTVSIGDIARAEGTGGTTQFSFTITLSSASTSSVSVAYSTADGTATAGSDFTATSGVLTFAPGETQKTVVVDVIGDTALEPNEAFFVNLGSPTNAVLGDAQGQGTIQDDEVGADIFEVNDTSATAKNLGKILKVNKSGLTLHTATDGDYFSFVPSKRGVYRVTVAPSQGTGSLNVELRNANQVILASNQAQSGTVVVQLTLAANTRYFVKVTSAAGSLYTYSLGIAKQSGGGARTIGVARGHGLALDGEHHDGHNGDHDERWNDVAAVHSRRTWGEDHRPMQPLPAKAPTLFLAPSGDMAGNEIWKLSIADPLGDEGGLARKTAFQV
jgi:hypothetical protein